MREFLPPATHARAVERTTLLEWYMRLGFREIRKARKITRAEMARAIGVGETSILKFERTGQGISREKAKAAVEYMLEKRRRLEALIKGRPM